MYRLTLSLVLPAIMLWAFSAQGQDNTDQDPTTRQGKIERLERMADSIPREADRLREDVSKNKDRWGKSFKGYEDRIKRFSDSIRNNWDFKFEIPEDLIDPDDLKFDFDLKEPEKLPGFERYQRPLPPYEPDLEIPQLPGQPVIPDIRPRNIQPAPRVIPKPRDGKEVPGFRGWRFQKVNLT